MTKPAPAAPELPGFTENLTRAPGRRLPGRIAAALIADGENFLTRAVDAITVDFDGIVGDHHRGATRMSGGREPWYPRGTEMRNERQISIVSGDELAEIAGALDIPEVRPEWIGANLVLADIPRLSWLPPRTRLFVEGGAVLVVEGQNAPCRISGAAIAAHHPLRTDISLLFPKLAKRLRGLVAWVEKPGLVAPGASVTARIPEQWIYK